MSLDELQVLHGDTFAPLMSSYLANGFKRDTCEISSLRVGPAVIESLWNVTECELPADGIYHLPAEVAFRMVGQVVIIHAGWFFNLKRKMGETWLRDYSIRCHRKILKREGISVSVRIPSQIYRKENMAVYQTRFSIEDDSFKGSATLLVTVG